MNATPHLARIEALAFTFNNADSLAMAGAAENAANNCPAFWHRASGGNAVVGGFMAYLNETQDVQRAWERHERDFGTECRMRNPKHLYSLLPLNKAAAKSLSEAYDALGVFFTVNELLSRTWAAETKALEALHELQTTGGTKHPLLTALGGIDNGRIEAAQDAIIDHRATLDSEVRADLKSQLQTSLQVA